MFRSLLDHHKDVYIIRCKKSGKIIINNWNSIRYYAKIKNKSTVLTNLIPDFCIFQERRKALRS